MWLLGPSTISVLVLFFLVILATPYAFCQSYEYVNIFDRRHIIEIDMNNHRFSSRDLGGNAEFCEKLDPYICIKSENFNFSVPRTRSAHVTHWTSRGSAYKLKESGVVVIFGQALKVSTIESSQNGIAFRFLYSNEHGLVAFSAKAQSEESTFISKTRLGFGNSSE